MASVAVTNTFASGTTISSSQVNTNFSDLVTYINNRNSASATWDVVSASSSTSVPLVTSNSTGTQNIFDAKDNATTVFSIVDGGRAKCIAGTSDTTNYTPFEISGGGGSASATHAVYTRTGVTTSAVQIGVPSQFMDFFLVVGDQSATDIFNDIIVTSSASATVSVVLSKTATGTPAARTYASTGSSSLTLQMGSGTYDIQTYRISLSGR